MEAIHMISLKEVVGKTKENIVQRVPIDMIIPSPYQPRKTFSNSSLIELCQSIKQYGVLQPITVRKVGNGKYELIAGERRLRASKMAGLTLIPCMVIDAMEEDSAIIALIENLQREDLHFMEEARGLQNLIIDHKFTQEQLAAKLGKSQSAIANKLRILKLPESVKKLIREANLTERHARALLRIPDEQLQLKIVRMIIDKNLNVRRTENLIEKTIQKFYTPAEGTRKNKLVVICKDLRIFINTIRRAVSTMKDSGIGVKYREKSENGNIYITIVIPKG
jgi:ParB family chromosome partitioning protein